MANSDLKRCPFCGGEAAVENREKYYNNTYEAFTARCRKCNARLGPFEYRWLAEASWNSRVHRKTGGILHKLYEVLRSWF